MGRVFHLTLIYVTLICVNTLNDAQARQQAVRTALTEAEREYKNARTHDYVARVIRDGLIVNAVRAGISQKEISGLVGDMSQPNVARAHKRAFTRRDVVPDGMLAADDALEQSGLGPAAFMDAVRTGRIAAKPIGTSGAWAFLPEDIRALAAR